MYAALALENEFFKTRTNKVLMISPCSVPMEESFKFVNEDLFKSLDEYNQFVLGGPDW